MHCSRSNHSSSFACAPKPENRWALLLQQQYMLLRLSFNYLLDYIIRQRKGQDIPFEILPARQNTVFNKEKARFYLLIGNRDFVTNAAPLQWDGHRNDDTMSGRAVTVGISNTGEHGSLQASKTLTDVQAEHGQF
jgi:hypothetical protein